MTSLTREPENWPEHRGPHAWMVVARNIKRFVCLDAAGNILCRHTHISAMVRHRKAARSGALLKNGEVIRIHMERVFGSNGERCILPFPVNAADYEAAKRSDKTWRNK